MRAKEKPAYNEENGGLITRNPNNWEAGTASLTYPNQAARGYGRYIGRVTELKDRWALVAVHRNEVIAQFDDYCTKLCYGWHMFTRNDFDIDFDNVRDDEQESTND